LANTANYLNQKFEALRHSQSAINHLIDYEPENQEDKLNQFDLLAHAYQTNAKIDEQEYNYQNAIDALQSASEILQTHFSEHYLLE